MKKRTDNEVFVCECTEHKSNVASTSDDSMAKNKNVYTYVFMFSSS